jgi:hypothetical protein
MRWLVWACGALVAAGLLSGLWGAPAPSQPEGSPAARPSQPTPTPSSSRAAADSLKARLLEDDALTPPPAGASRDELRTYRSFVEAVANGQDPLAGDARAKQASGYEARLAARRSAAAKHRDAEKAKRDAMHEAKRREHEEKRKANEGRVLPPPLIPPPVLGPPLSGVEPDELKDKPKPR